MTSIRKGIACVVLFAGSAAAQCTLQWQPGPAVPGPAGIVHAVVELPDGRVLAGGQFTWADASRVDNLAVWDGVQWLPFHGGTDGNVYALAVLPNGDVVAGGSFSFAGGTAAPNLARFDGVAWQPFGAGANGTVWALRVEPSGDLIVGGGFTTLDNVPASCIGRWSSGGFRPLGSGVDSPDIFTRVVAIDVMPNGDLVIGGMFGSVGGVQAPMVARWNGVAWSGVPAFALLVFVTSLVAMPNGDLIVGHDNGLVRWDGVTATALASSAVYAMTLDTNGHLVVGGQFASIAGVTAKNAARWDGSAWQALGAGRPDTVRCLGRRSDGTLVAGGGHTGTSAFPRSVATWSVSTASWIDLGAPSPEADYLSIRAMARLPDGDVVVVGSFTSFHAIPANGIARWNGVAWAPMGPGLAGVVTCVTGSPSGDVFVGGEFSVAGGSPAKQVARWDGTAWSVFGGTLPNLPRQITAGDNLVFVAHATLPGPTVVSAGTGGAFAPIGTFAFNVLAMIAEGDELIAAGVLPGGGVQRWNGVWSAVGTLPGPSVMTMVKTPDGDLVVGGYFPGNSGVHRWDGANWLPMGNLGTVHSLAVLANGDLVESGSAPFPHSMMRWNGSNWQHMGDAAESPVHVVASGYGDLFVKGPFFACGGQVGGHFARAVTNCPAAAAPFGSGCVGSAGPVGMAAHHRPWVGASFVTEATGVSTPSIALQVLGVQQVLPPLPFGGPGCDLHVDPIVFGLMPPVGAGRARAEFAIADDLSLLGLSFLSQAIVLELDAAGYWIGTATSNALALVVGDM